MPIKLNGTTFNNGGTAKYNNTSLMEIKYGSTTVWKKEVTITDKINFKGWSITQPNTYPNTNSQNEQLMPSSNAFSTGIVLYPANPAIGYTANGSIYQTVSLVSGRKYYVAVGGAGYGGAHLVANFPNYTGEYWADQWQNTYLNNSAIWTSNVNGNYTVRLTASSDGGYCRIWYATIVDLTGTFGSGKEPNLTWCESNIGRAFNGSKNVTPP